MTILGKNYLKTMEKEIDISQIPEQYGGRSERAVDDSDDERKVMTTRITVTSRTLFVGPDEKEKRDSSGARGYGSG